MGNQVIQQIGFDLLLYVHFVEVKSCHRYLVNLSYENAQTYDLLIDPRNHLIV